MCGLGFSQLTFPSSSFPPFFLFFPLFLPSLPSLLVLFFPLSLLFPPFHSQQVDKWLLQDQKASGGVHEQPAWHKHRGTGRECMGGGTFPARFPIDFLLESFIQAKTLLVGKWKEQQQLYQFLLASPSIWVKLSGSIKNEDHMIAAGYGRGIEQQQQSSNNLPKFHSTGSCWSQHSVN